MTKQLLLSGVIMACLASTAVFADDNDMQGGQMNQSQSMGSQANPTNPADNNSQNSGDMSTQGNTNSGDQTQTQQQQQY